MIDQKLLLIAAHACAKSYEQNVDLGSSEYCLSKTFYNGGPLQILAMPGTNEMSDWLWNLHLWSSQGVKRCTYLSVKKIHKAIEGKINPYIPLLVTGHSKAGPDALWWKAKYGANYCVAFCPPPAFRRWNKPVLQDTTIVIDQDDLVPMAGMISFTQPEVSEIITLPDDKKWYDIKGMIGDHSMGNIVAFLENNKKIPTA
jgi:hypothetical protein